MKYYFEKGFENRCDLLSSNVGCGYRRGDNGNGPHTSYPNLGPVFVGSWS